MAQNDNDLIAKQCRAEYDAGLLFRHDREKAWQNIEDLYFNRVLKSLKSKFNVPVPILPGFVDTWQSKMASHADLKFESDANEAEYPATLKTTALYVKIRSKDDYDWDMADTDGKKMACLSGRAIYKYYADSVKGYTSHLEPVDHYDFIADPKGGGHLENHMFAQQDNIFRSREDLLAGVGKLYDKEQVEKIINSTEKDVIVNNDNIYRSKQNRFTALGLNGLIHNYAGQTLYKFIEAGTTWKGKRYYVLFNYETGVWVRCQPLKEVFKSGLWPFTSWATHRDTFNFWSKGPCDDMVPMTEMIRILVNQELDNRNKLNYGQRAYDPDMFVNPAELEWRPDGLVTAKSNLGAKKIADGIYEFQTPELEGTVNLVTWIDNMLQAKTGMPTTTQTDQQDNAVGIAYLNVQQTGERTVLIYEAYVKCWQAIGRRFLWGLSEHMRSPIAVRMIGEQGATWDDLARREINTEWNIRVDGSDMQTRKDEIRKKALTDMFAALAPDEIEASSPKWRLKTKLQIAGVDDDDIRLAFDLGGDQDKQILAMASQMIQDCLDGKPYKPYRGANTAFVQKIVDYATDEDVSDAEFKKLMGIAQAHMPIAAKNAARKAVAVNAAKGQSLPSMASPPQPNPALKQYLGMNGGQPPPGQPGPAGPAPAPSGPPPNTPSATQAISQNAANLAPTPPAINP